MGESTRQGVVPLDASWKTATLGRPLNMPSLVMHLTPRATATATALQRHTQEQVTRGLKAMSKLTLPTFHLYSQRLQQLGPTPT